jgi:hypothetical protein
MFLLVSIDGEELMQRVKIGINKWNFKLRSCLKMDKKSCIDKKI